MDVLVDTDRVATIDCARCPFNHRAGFRPHESTETLSVRSFKRREIDIPAGETVYGPDLRMGELFTVLEGWGHRNTELADGRRQLLNFVFPGDFLGLQAVLDGPREHSVVALTPMRLCVFEASDLPEHIARAPELSHDVIWTAASEERMLEGHLVGVGRRNALERLAYMLAYINDRGVASGLREAQEPITPLTQSLLADMLGMSLVHTNKTLRQLQADALVRWRGRRVFIDDIAKLRRVARWQGLSDRLRRFV